MEVLNYGNEEICERYKFLNELAYFEDILGSYNYSEDKIDDEVIARFVQVIAKYKFEPSIMHINNRTYGSFLARCHSFIYGRIKPIL